METTSSSRPSCVSIPRYGGGLWEMQAELHLISPLTSFIPNPHTPLKHRSWNGPATLTRIQAYARPSTGPQRVRNLMSSGPSCNIAPAKKPSSLNHEPPRPRKPRSTSLYGTDLPEGELLMEASAWERPADRGFMGERGFRSPSHLPCHLLSSFFSLSAFDCWCGTLLFLQVWQ